LMLLRVAFIISFLYNAIGMYFAFTGQLSPVLSAVLMPLSSITIIVTGVVGTYLLSMVYLKK